MSSEHKIAFDTDTLESRLDALPHPFVFTNGCFDILHRGHVDYLEKAASLGATLIVGLNSDTSLKRLNKGAERPLNPLEDRAAILAALQCVSLVVPFDQDTPLELIKRIRPEHLVKGGDWTPAEIVGANEVQGWGGKVHSIPVRFQRSTTELIKRMRASITPNPT